MDPLGGLPPGTTATPSALSRLTLCDSHGWQPSRPLSTGFFRQDCWSGVAIYPGDLPNLGVNPMSPVTQTPRVCIAGAASLLRHLESPLDVQNRSRIQDGDCDLPLEGPKRKQKSKHRGKKRRGQESRQSRWSSLYDSAGDHLKGVDSTNTVVSTENFLKEES